MPIHTTCTVYPGSQTSSLVSKRSRYVITLATMLSTVGRASVSLRACPFMLALACISCSMAKNRPSCYTTRRLKISCASKASRYIFAYKDLNCVVHCVTSDLQEGRIFNSPESTKNIPYFIKTYSINTEELLKPNVDEYGNFNEFFYR
jgi:hypothetical protein